MENKKAFISYSWDDDAHKTWVVGLAERLVLNGVHVFLDQWDVRPGDSLTQFMDTSLPACDFALAVCTPSYATKSVSRIGGVGYEAQIITSSLAAGMLRSKFVPLIRKGEIKPGSEDCAVPPHFFGIFALDMRDDAKFDRMLSTAWKPASTANEPVVPLGASPSRVMHSGQVCI